MSLEYLAKLTAENEGDPYLACKGGYADIVGYKDCANCPHYDCDILALEQARSTMDKIILQSIKSGAAKAEDYCLDEFGHLAPAPKPGFFKRLVRQLKEIF